MIIYQDTKAGFVDDIAVAIEYHCSPIGRSRIDVLLAGSDGRRDNGLIIELKAWDKADAAMQIAHPDNAGPA